MAIYAYLVENDTSFICWDCLRKTHAMLAYQGFPNGGGEADAPQHCDSCGVFLENPLTDEGVQYVLEAIEEGSGSCIAEWAAFYDLNA